jgi:hypothetical protein
VKLHIGFTGTRFGMSEAQRSMVRHLVEGLVLMRPTAYETVAAHHGMCVGADAEFHAICRALGASVIGHPGPPGEWSADLICDEMLEPTNHMRRNAAIVAASSIMIAAPRENTPQPRGGTWATIGMARRELRRLKLGVLHVVDREGRLMDHKEWP